ncbi:MAG TPA: hypothetical protein VHE83_07840 [Mycobacteriales bacterium]|nr:hypothetical protein [Mycobacteriales bacterium]
MLAALSAVAAVVLVPGGSAGAAACGPPAPPQLALSGPLHLWGPDHNGNWHVVGAVDNRGTGAAAEVAVGYTVLDAAGRPLVSDKRFTWSPLIGPGQDSGFDAPLFQPARPPAAVRFTGITYGTPTTVPHRFPVTVTTVTHQSGGAFGHLAGTARNDLSVPIFSIALSAVLRNAAGDVVGIVPGTTNDIYGDGQAPGATESWTMNIDPAIPAWSTYTVEAVSDTPAGYAPIPSPCLSPVPSEPAPAAVQASGRPVAAVAPHTLAPSIPDVTVVATRRAPAPTAHVTVFPTVVPNAVAAGHRVDRTPWLWLAFALVVVVGFLTSLVAGRRAEER